MGKKISICIALGLAAFAGASTVNVDLDEEHQVIRGFGGMVHNQWQGGSGLSEADAQLAFGTGDGQIGLNTLRIPVYANSSDFNKEVQAAKYAKAVAGNDFILYATPWTSPYAGANQHMSENNYQKYVDHLNSFTEYMKNQGVPLYAISISNEPDWCGEWACWSADEIYKFTVGYADKMRKNDTKVISTESFRYAKNLYDKVLNDPAALKNWDILGAHFYASEANTDDGFFQYPLADQKGVERWMTEHYTESQGSGNYWRVVTNTGDQANQNKRDTVRAMDVGYEIHRGLAIGNFSQYTWWYIRRCYGLIMEKDFGNKLSIPSGEIGKVSKRGYVLSQFARFIRPGAVRVGATINPEPEVYASAYKSAGGDSVIVVLVNRDYKNGKTVTINVPGANIETFHVYTTSEAKNAEDEGEIEVKNGSATITMNAGNSTNKDCIVTLVGVGSQVVVPREPYNKELVVLPGRIDTEDYDVPGSGKGNKTYSDNDSENKGKAYREDGVDIVKIDENDESKGYAIGYTNAGEWLEYTIKVEKEGEYPISANVASGSATSSFRLFVDGSPVTDTIPVPKTADNDWSVYKVIEAGSTTLTAGEHIVRLEITGSYANIDWFAFGDPTLQNKVSADGTEKARSISSRYSIKHGQDSYALYDIRGSFIGKVQASNLQELRLNASNLVKRGGAYLARSSTGATLRVQIVK